MAMDCRTPGKTANGLNPNNGAGANGALGNPDKDGMTNSSRSLPRARIPMTEFGSTHYNINARCDRSEHHLEQRGG